MGQIELSFESEVTASPADAWRWITSIKGISAEMRPYFRMTVPRGVENIEDLNITLGQALFRSRIYLFEFFPIGHSDLTLIEMREGEGFVEQSPMSSMNLWRHDRRIVPTANGSRIIDHLTFQPKSATGVTAWFIRTVFHHRHKVIRRRLNEFCA